MGCLRSLATKIGCLVMLAVPGTLGWIYRHDIARAYHAWRGGGGSAEVWVAPEPFGADSARARLRRLAEPGGPAYQDLTAGQLAALITEALGEGGRQVFDSVQVALLEGEIRVRGILDLSGVPRDVLGPLEDAVGRKPPATIGGPLAADSTGRLILTVTYLKLREFPFPRGTIARLLEAAHVPGARADRVPVPGAPRLGDVRVSPRGVRCYRMSPQ